MTSNAGIHSIGRAFCQFKPTMRATTGRHHNRSALLPRAKSLVSQLCSDMRTSTASCSNSPCAIHFHFTAVREGIGHLLEDGAGFRRFRLLLQCSIAFVQSSAQMHFQSLKVCFLLTDSQQFCVQEVAHFHACASLLTLKMK